jgi:deoxycytidylate deaminase
MGDLTTKFSLREIEKLQMLMEVATKIAKLSKDPRTQVGAVLVNSKTFQILSTGYNGMPAKVDETTLWEDKYEYVVHAEMNAVMFCRNVPTGIEDIICVCTHAPCVRCVAHLLQFGVNTFIHLNDTPHHCSHAKNLLSLSGSSIFQLSI